MEGHGTGVQQLYDRAKQALRLETDRATPLREAVLACRKGGMCHPRAQGARQPRRLGAVRTGVEEDGRVGDV